MYNIFLIYITWLLTNFQISICNASSNSIDLMFYHKIENGINYLKCKKLDETRAITLLEGETAEVRVNYNKIINDGSCFYSGNRHNVFTQRGVIHYNRSTSILKINKMAAGKWNCMFYTLYGVGNIYPVVMSLNGELFTQVLCTFKVHVRLLNGPTMKINEAPVMTIRESDLMTTADYIGVYYFHPNYPLYIECIRPNGGSISISLKSSDKQHTFLDTSNDYKNTKFYIKPIEDYNNTHLDYMFSPHEDELVVRVNMLMMNPANNVQGPLIVKINAEILVPIPGDTIGLNTANQYNLLYDITYRNDTEFKITCEYTGNTDDARLKLVLSNFTQKIQNPKPGRKHVYKDIPSAIVSDGSVVKCALKENPNSITEYILTFIQRKPSVDLYISGLAIENILLDHEENGGYSHIIHYHYNEGDSLSLNCYCKRTNCNITWTVEGLSTIKSTNQIVFHLDMSFDQSIINCRNNNHDKVNPEVIIKLVYNRKTDSVESATTAYPGSIYGKEKHVKEVGSGSYLEKYIFELTGGAIVCLFIIFLASVIFYCRRSKAKNLQNEPMGIEYETLHSHNSTGNNTNMNNTYSQPLDTFNGTEYSEPYKPNLNELYARPVPKSMRHGAQAVRPDENGEANNVNSDTPKEVTYAELSLAKPKDIYAEVLPKNVRNAPKSVPFESNYAEFYAEVVPISQSNYGNVSDNERYVNNDGRDDYAEPAYCELLVKRRINK